MNGVGVPEAGHGTVTLITARNSSQVSLPGLDELPGYLPESQRDALSSTIDGTYKGRVMLVGAGSDQQMGSTGSDSSFALDVRASVWGDLDDAVIEIADPFDLLTQEDSLIGRLSVDATTGQGMATFPTAPYLDIKVGGRDSKLLAETTDAIVLTSDKPRSLRLSVTQRYIGSGADIAPAVRWVLDLRREGDVSGEAPAVPADATLGYNAKAVLVARTPWENLFIQKSEDVPDSGGEDLTFQEIGEIFNGLYRGDNSIWLSRFRPGYSRGGGLSEAFVLLVEAISAMAPSYSEVGAAANGGKPLADDWGDLFKTHPRLSPSEVVYTDWSSSSGSPSFTFTEGTYHCRFTDLTLSATIDGVTASTQPLARDECEKYQRVYGCEIVPLSSPTPFDLTASVITSSGDSGSISMTGTGTHGCLVPDFYPYVGEMVACVDPPANDDGDDYQGLLLSPTALPGIGDLECHNGTRSLTFPIDLETGLAGSEIRSACLEEVATLADAPVGAPSSSSTSGLAQTYEDGTCVNVPRLLTALGLQTHSLRALPGDELLSLDAEVYSAAFTHRLLTRWIQLHAYLSNEGVQSAVAAAALAQLADPVETEPLGAYLGGSLEGWDLLYAPHVLNALMIAPPSAYLDPDYRHIRHGLIGDANDDQNTALAEAMLDAVARQAQLVTTILEHGEPAAEEERFLAVEALLPRVIVASAVAIHMHDRADSADPNFIWRDSFARDQRRAATALRDLFSEVDNIRAGKNPLGIEDEDLPLYFDAAMVGDSASGKFAALSDFLAGRNGQSGAIAPEAVSTAEASLMSVRQAFLAEHDRRVRDAHSDRDFVRWVGNVRDEYNAILRDYCGPEDESLVDLENFDPRTCGISPDPACQPDFNGWYSHWTQADLMGRLCLQREFRERSLNDVGFYSLKAREFATSCVGSDTSRTDAVRIVDCPQDSSKKCLRCDAVADVDDVVLDASTLEIAFPALDATDETSRALVQSVVSACRDEHPTMNLSVPLPTKNLEQPGCIGGSLGSAYLDIVAAERDLQEARAAIEEHTDAYDIAFSSCLILDQANSELQSLREEHTQNMQGLRVAKGVADSVSTVAAGVKDCASTLVGGLESPFSAVAAGVLGGVACGAAAVESTANVVSIGLEVGIENAQQSHDDSVAKIEEDAEVEICFNDARQELVGLKTAAIQLERASFDLNRAKADYDEMLIDAQRVYEDGHAYLEEVENWPLPDPAGDLWSSDALLTYEKDFRLARRATYLAVRAVEYEFQASLSVRQEVFDARTPIELRQNVLAVLWQDANTRGINGSMPTELNSVVSLRDDIFRLGDESNYPESFRKLTPAERFKLLLSNPAYAVYEDGEYVGQRIPFTLAPLGALGYETRGVSIFAQNDCAERLWSLNASILGQDLYKGSDTSNVRVDVLKRNTFFSQWCTDPADGEERFQLASVRPNRNLFREPGAGANVDVGAGADRGVEAFSRARVQAFFNVSRADFEDPRYESGATGELAARGLYGDYALFIPAAQISRDGSNGLVLENVEDILIRLDYVSVASN